MGLTVYYDWKVKAELPAAYRLISKLHRIAQELPFDRVSEVYEQGAPQGAAKFQPYTGKFCHGWLYLPRKRGDGEEELVHVPAIHAIFFTAQVAGAETVLVGLASHPPVVVHCEDVIERDEDGQELRRFCNQGEPIEFPTRRRGYYSWHSFCKTQYAGNPRLGGEANFLKAHLSLIELFDRMMALGVKVCVRDDSQYAKHRDVNRLLASLRQWDAIVAGIAGKLSDALRDDSNAVLAPIIDRPDFEHLEAKGMDEIKKLAARQRRRKKGG
jgi:hypothetical protein